MSDGKSDSVRLPRQPADEHSSRSLGPDGEYRAMGDAEAPAASPQVPPPPLARATSSSTGLPSEREQSGLLMLRRVSSRMVHGGMVEVFYCQLCFVNVPVDQQYELPGCQHSFCRSCLVDYIETTVNGGSARLVCYASVQAEGKETANAGTASHGNTSNNGVCGQEFPESVVQDLASAETLAKYRRFKANQNPRMRQCPKCDFSMLGNEATPQMKCTQCGTEFCFNHNDAHPGSTCAEFERRHREETALSKAAMSKIAKPCPKCQTMIMKSSGCNHMKCIRCEAHFCWLCGKEVDDGEFPDHYQWWNIMGCPNQQMQDVSRAQSIFMTLFAFFLSLLFGVPAFLLTLAFTLVCFCVPCLLVSQSELRAWPAFKAYFINGISLFGYILMLIVLGPVFCVCCPVFVLLFACFGNRESTQPAATPAQDTIPTASDGEPEEGGADNFAAVGPPAPAFVAAPVVAAEV